jgi:hypothetical protein
MDRKGGGGGGVNGVKEGRKEGFLKQRKKNMWRKGGGKGKGGGRRASKVRKEGRDPEATKGGMCRGRMDGQEGKGRKRRKNTKTGKRQEWNMPFQLLISPSLSLTGAARTAGAAVSTTATTATTTVRSFPYTFYIRIYLYIYTHLYFYICLSIFTRNSKYIHQHRDRVYQHRG